MAALPAAEPAGLAGLLALVLLLPALGGCISGPPASTETEDEELGANSLEDGPGGSGSGNGGSKATEANTEPTPPPEPPWVGAWLGTWPTSENRAIETFHATTDVRLDVVDTYASWEVPPEHLRGPFQRIAASGAQPLVTWQPANLTTPEIARGTTEFTLSDNTTITVDAYLDRFALIACEVAELTDKRVLLRPLGDANGDWHTWSVGWRNETRAYPNTPETYQAAWAHVHDRVTSACTDGVAFLWSINHVNIGPGTGYTNAYPGPEVVDYVGISGFNWGAAGPFGWQSFDAVYSKAYCNVTEATDHPVILTALGTAEAGGDKPAWIEQALERVASGVYNVSGIVWFHDTQAMAADGPQADLRVTSSPATATAFQESVTAMREGTLVDQAATWEICQAPT